MKPKEDKKKSNKCRYLLEDTIKINVEKNTRVNQDQYVNGGYLLSISGIALKVFVDLNWI